MKKTIGILFSLFFVNIVQSATVTDVIDKPGIYKYRTTVIAQPTDPNDSVITIASSNVVLDLDGYLLMQHPLVTTTGFSGIVINEGLSNIAIRNGRIDNFTGNGIKVSDGCHKIKVENMVISNCDAGGILIDGLASGTGVDSFLMNDTLLLSSTGFNDKPAYGLKAENATAIGIYDCFFNDNDTVTTSSGFGVYMNSCACIQFIRCVFTDNGGTDFGIGCYISNSMNICLQGCLALHNIARATNSVAAGYYFDNCKKAVCLSCKCIETVNSVGESVGFFSKSGTANLFQNCISEANDGGSIGAGFHLNGETDTVIINSRSIDNEGVDTSGAGYGIYLEGAFNDKCHLSKNNLIGNKGGTKSRGIEDERNPSTSNVVRNSAFNNGTNFVINYPAGITLPTIEGSLSNNLIGLPTLTAGELENIDINP